MRIGAIYPIFLCETLHSVGEAFIQLQAWCGSVAPAVVRADGTPWVGRTSDGGWIPDNQTPINQLRAEIPGSSFVFDKTQCADGRVHIHILAQGKFVEFQGLEVTLSRNSELLEHQYNRIANERISKATANAKILSLLSDAAGSQESAYCLIDEYKDQPEFSGIIEELSLQYSKNYHVAWTADQFTCPIAAEAVLSSEVKECEKDPSSLDTFCLIFARYAESKAWYDNSITSLESSKASLAQAGSDLYKKIDSLINTMEKDLKVSEDMLRSNN